MQTQTDPTPSGKPSAPKGKSEGAILDSIDALLGLNGEKEMPIDLALEKMTPEEREALMHYEEGIQKALDLIAPAGMHVKRNELILNDLHAKTYFVHNWPNYIFPNWLSPTINYDAEMDISHFIYPVSNKAIMKMLRKKVAEMRSSIRMLEQRGVVRDPALEAALQDAEELRDLLARGEEKIFQFGMYLTLYSEDEVKLKKMEADLESLLSGKLVLTKPAVFQMEHAWKTALPFCIDEMEINRNMNTRSVATSFPFTSSDLTDDHGILYGINRHNESLVIFDRFDLANANATVFATSGAGKSFTVKLEILRSLMFGTEVFIIDPENEYVELAQTVGGTHVPVSLQSTNYINPFDLPKAVSGDDEKPGEVLRSAVIALHGLFKIMLGELTPEEDGILDKSILDTYALRDITMQTENPGEKEPPTLRDLIDVLSTTEGGQNMAKTLQKYTEGSYAGLFDQPTNVELDNQVVVFQIRDLEDALRPIAMYIILNFLWNRIRSDMKRRFLVIDEAWNLMQHDDSARFLYGLIKRARKYYLGVTTITQDIEDFVNSEYGKPIVSNAQLQILLKQSPTSVDKLQKLFYLTDGEKYLLLNSDVGQGLFFAGSRHVAIQIIASPEEEAIITTNPEEVIAAKKQKSADALVEEVKAEEPQEEAVQSEVEQPSDTAQEQSSTDEPSVVVLDEQSSSKPKAPQAEEETPPAEETLEPEASQKQDEKEGTEPKAEQIDDAQQEQPPTSEPSVVVRDEQSSPQTEEENQSTEEEKLQETASEEDDKLSPNPPA